MRYILLTIFLVSVFVFFNGCVTENSCSQYWALFAKANNTFSSKDEALSFLTNMDSSNYTNAQTNVNLTSALEEIKKQAIGGKINKDTLREVKLKQVIEENYKLSNCWINTSESDLKNNQEIDVYNVYGEKWFLTKDGRLIHFYLNSP